MRFSSYRTHVRISACGPFGTILHPRWVRTARFQAFDPGCHIGTILPHPHLILPRATSANQPTPSLVSVW
jgi:hypothetical protein